MGKSPISQLQLDSRHRAVTVNQLAARVDYLSEHLRTISGCKRDGEQEVAHCDTRGCICNGVERISGPAKAQRRTPVSALQGTLRRIGASDRL